MKDLPQCKEKIVHTKENETRIGKMPKDEMICDLADIFKVFGDSTRIKIIYTIANQSLCVCDIADIVNMSQSAVSHQLKVLKQARLVTYEKVGKEVHYRLDDEHIKNIFVLAVEHVKERNK